MSLSKRCGEWHSRHETKKDGFGRKMKRVNGGTTVGNMGDIGVRFDSAPHAVQISRLRSTLPTSTAHGIVLASRKAKRNGAAILTVNGGTTWPAVEDYGESYENVKSASQNTQLSHHVPNNKSDSVREHVLARLLSNAVTSAVLVKRRLTGKVVVM